MKTRRSVPLVVLLGLVLVGSHPSAQVMPVTGLVVDRTGVVGKQIKVTVRNVGTLQITAFAVHGHISYETGKTEKFGMAADGAIGAGFFVPDGPSFRRQPFEPGVVLTLDCGVALRDGTVKAVSLMPTAIIFADATSVGDEQAIKRLFEARARERRVLGTIFQILSDVDTSTQSLQASTAITEAQERLATAGETEEVRDSPYYMNVVQNLALASRLLAQDPTRLRARLAQLVNDARAWRTLADQHYQPR